MSTPRPVLLALSALAGVDVVIAGAAFQDVIGETAAGLALLVMAAVKVGVAFYLQGQVVPLKNTVAYARHGDVVAGGASSRPSGRIMDESARLGHLVDESAVRVRVNDDVDDEGRGRL